MDLFLHWQSNLHVLLVNCNTHIVNFMAAFWIIIIIKYTKSQHQAWSSAFCFVHCYVFFCFIWLNSKTAQNPLHCTWTGLAALKQFFLILPKYLWVSLFTGRSVAWSMFLQNSFKWGNVERVKDLYWKKKKPALILVLRSLSKCESEFYCQHQTT